MNPPSHYEAHIDLLTDLVEALIEKPRDLQIVPTPLPGRVDWWLNCATTDKGKVIGSEGAHVKSLRVLIALMGRRFYEDWRLTVDRTDAGVRGARREIAPALVFDAEPLHELLCDLVESILDAEAAVDCTPVEPPGRGFDFTIRPGSAEDYATLARPIPVDGIELTPIAALGILFKAIARQNGTAFRVETPAAAGRAGA